MSGEGEGVDREELLAQITAALAGYEHYEGALLVGAHADGFLAGWNLMWHEAHAVIRGALPDDAEGKG